MKIFHIAEIQSAYHCVNCVRNRSFSGLYFHSFGLNMERQASYLSIISPNAEKYGPEKLLIRTNFTQCIVYIFKMALNLFTKFGHSDHNFKKNIVTQMCLKSETSAHAHLAITSLYILFTNFLTWYQFETYIKPHDEPFWGYKGYDVIILVHGITSRLLLRDSNYIVTKFW